MNVKLKINFELFREEIDSLLRDVKNGHISAEDALTNFSLYLGTLGDDLIEVEVVGVSKTS